MKTTRFVGSWIRAVAGTLAVAACIWLLAQWLFGFRLLDVQTGSMVPTFRPADALIIRLTSKPPYLGEIVSYQSARNPNELITHRVIAVSGKRFQTKGDALTAPDPAVGTNLLKGKIVLALPGMGHVLRWLRSPAGLVVCVYVPALALAFTEVRKLERHFSRYRLYRLNRPQVL